MFGTSSQIELPEVTQTLALGGFEGRFGGCSGAPSCLGGETPVVVRSNGGLPHTHQLRWGWRGVRRGAGGVLAELEGPRGVGGVLGRGPRGMIGENGGIWR